MPPKKKNSSWPLRDVKVPHANDVLSGRGGGTNHHPGNKKYRELVEERKAEYVASERLDKPMVAAEIVRIVRQQNPPGRFLKHDHRTGLWNDVGDKEAKKKVSQALREGASEIREQKDIEAPATKATSQRDREKENNDLQRRKNQIHAATSDAEGKESFSVARGDGAPMVKQAILSHYETRNSFRGKVGRPPQDEKMKNVVDSDLSKTAPVDNGIRLPVPIPRPNPTKRTTSNENESSDTKKDLKGVSVKRAALKSRERSLTAKTLKEAFLRAYANSGADQTASNSELPPLHPSIRRSSYEYKDTDVDSREGSGEVLERDETNLADIDREISQCDKELRRLSSTLEQTRLSGFIAPAREFSEEDRMRDMDYLYAELTNDPLFEKDILS